MSRRIRFYTAHGCLLCEETWRRTTTIASLLGVAVERVHIGDDPEGARYLDRVPVLVDRDRVVAEGNIGTFDLVRALLATWLPRRGP